ncbi:MAG: FAD:protein FMN transferase [Longimicrobiales bacterium]|nr:FAD:protein FMN transferase [Longimicrobiales bacterium]
MIKIHARATALILLLLATPAAAQVLAGTAASAPAGETVERESYLMGTRLSLEIHAADAAAAAERVNEAVRGVERLLSTWREDTELSGLNRAPVAERHSVSPALMAVLEETGSWVVETGRAFDPAVGPLLDAWDVREGELAEPGPAELAAARKAAGWHRIVLEPTRSAVTRTVPGVWIDAGAFGKGLALREAAGVLRSAGASGTLNFGGQIVAVGASARVDVADAGARDRGLLTLTIRNASVATTGLSERGGHVLDPRSGRPVEDWGSVTVVAEDPMEADILSTALYVMGPEAAVEWALERPQGVLIQDARSGEVVVRWNGAMESWLEGADAVAGPEAAVETAAVVEVAEAAPARQDTSEIERLKRQVEAITRELERIRLGEDVVTRADTGILGFGPAASKVYKVDQGVSIGGYGEILFEMFSDELEDGTESPTDNVWDAYRGILYFGYKFNDKLLVNTEIEIEHANEAFLEFAYIDYRISEKFGLRGGLLLSPMGLINELHEPPVFLGSTRPMVEQRIIPTTWRENGLGVFGDVGDFTYRVYALNGLNGAGNFDGSGLRGGRQKGSDALAEDVAGVARVDYTGTPGLLAGGSVYYGGSGQGRTVTLDGVEQEIQANTLIWEAHASYKSGGLDLRGLVAGASVGDAVLLNAYREGAATTAETVALTGTNSVGERLLGGYAHVGYDVLRNAGTTHQLFPYVRYEYLNTQAEVPEGFTVNPARERTAILLGASWKPVPQVAVKADYQIHSNQAETGRSKFAMVLSYLF